MAPATKSSRKTSTAPINPRAVLPDQMQAYVNRLAENRIRELVHRGVLSVNADNLNYKPSKVVVQTAPSQQMFIPRMDVYDNPESDRIIATFEIPGVRSSDMGLSIQDGNLIIEGRRRCPMEHCGAATANASSSSASTSVDPPTGTDMQVDGHPARTTTANAAKVRAAVKELRFGKFHRAVGLPSGVKQSDIQATMFEGMLTVSWPRDMERNVLGPEVASFTALKINNA